MAFNLPNMQTINKILFITGFFFSFCAGGEKNNVDDRTSYPVNFFSHSLANLDTVQSTDKNIDAVKNPRLTTALIYSCVMPGSGQTMLGHSTKGVAFSIVAFGSALTTLISHNNYIARVERMDALEFQYANATNWASANNIYLEMLSAHKLLQSDKNRRNLFLLVTAVVWSVNIFDVLYFTDDRGGNAFSQREFPETAVFALFNLPHQPILSVSIPLGN
jgi:hypothetical protein